MHVCVKMMSKGSKEALTVLIVIHVTQVKRAKKWCLRLLRNAAYRVLLLILFLMSKGSNMSNTMYCTLYTGLLAPPGGKAICYLKSLPSCGFSGSPPVSLRKELC